MPINDKKIQEDKGLILSIIKYAMIAAIVLCVLFFGARLFGVLFPVVIGFFLAYSGYNTLGWKIGFTSALIGNIVGVLFLLLKFFGKHIDKKNEKGDG